MMALAIQVLASECNVRLFPPLLRVENFHPTADGSIVKLFAKVPYHHYDAGRLDEGVRMLKGLRNMVVEAIVVLWEG